MHQPFISAWKEGICSALVKLTHFLPHTTSEFILTWAPFSPQRPEPSSHGQVEAISTIRGKKSPSHRMQGGGKWCQDAILFCPPPPPTFLPCSESNIALAHQQKSRGRLSCCPLTRRTMGMTILG